MGGDNFSGILLIDKPANITSAGVVAVVKRVLKVKKVGHTGTLDPLATGVMVCCINNATRLARFFLHGNKKYQAVIQLGQETDTQDSTGKIITICDQVDYEKSKIIEAFGCFEGIIEQVPPTYSALKHKGVPLYKYARKGKIIQKPARQVKIVNINICNIDLPLIHFEVTCSAGTYIRTLCADIGKHLGCGGILKELRRTESNEFHVGDAIPLEKLESLVLSGNLKDHLISMVDSLKNMSTIVVEEELANKIRHGVTVNKNDLLMKSHNHPEGFIKIIDKNNNLIAVLCHDLRKDRLKYCCVFL